jgi:hypothetical protein
MYMMATRVSDASSEWTKLRKSAVRVVQGVDGLVMGGALAPATDASAVQKPAVEEIEKPKEEVENKDDQALVDGVTKPLVKKRKKAERQAAGVYDPHSHTIHCEIFFFNHGSHNILLFELFPQIGQIHNLHRLDGKLSQILLRNGVCWVVRKRVMVLGPLPGLILLWNCLVLTL